MESLWRGDESGRSQKNYRCPVSSLRNRPVNLGRWTQDDCEIVVEDDVKVYIVGDVRLTRQVVSSSLDKTYVNEYGKKDTTVQLSTGLRGSYFESNGIDVLT